MIVMNIMIMMVMIVIVMMMMMIVDDDDRDAGDDDSDAGDDHDDDGNNENNIGQHCTFIECLEHYYRVLVDTELALHLIGGGVCIHIGLII